MVTPWGDLWFVEDGGGHQRVMGITPGGEVYEFARNRLIGASDGRCHRAGPQGRPPAEAAALETLGVSLT